MVRDAFELRNYKQHDVINMQWVHALYSQIDTVAERLEIPYERIVFISLYGSQNYNLATVNSDVDSECFIFPSCDDIIFARQLPSMKIHNEYGDIYVKDIRLMFEELRKCSPNMLEVLASKYILINKKYSDQINGCLLCVNDFAKLSTYKLLKGLEGLFHRYAEKFTKAETTPKDIVNILRVSKMIEKIINEENFCETLIPDNYEELLKIKNGEIEYNDEEILKNHIIKTYQKLLDYYEKHELSFQPQIKQSINDFQKKILRMYLYCYLQ